MQCFWNNVDSDRCELGRQRLAMTAPAGYGSAAPPAAPRSLLSPAEGGRRCPGLALLRGGIQRQGLSH